MIKVERWLKQKAFVLSTQENEEKKKMIRDF